MPLGYSPEAKEENEYDDLEEGKYPFKVDIVEEKFFKTGNEGLKVKLLVGYEGRDVPCFANLAYTPKALWRLKQFLDCIGLDFDNPPEVTEIRNKTGMADFVLNDKGYFEVERWLDPIEQAEAFGAQTTPKTKGKPAAEAKEFGYGPPPMVDDDVPF